jgi:hypothetical protein
MAGQPVRVKTFIVTGENRRGGSAPSISRSVEMRLKNRQKLQFLR